MIEIYRHARIALPLCALAALAACGSDAPEADDPAASAAPPAAGSTSQPPPASPPDSEPSTGIPDAMQGRWGLVAADCEAGRPDAKGLLIVTAEGLEFYESIGNLGAVESRGADRMRASFDFTGEGMSWERDMALTLENGGERLALQEFGSDAAPEPLSYSRCP